jgi:hypothetical protein
MVSILYQSQCLDVDDSRRSMRTKLRTSEADHLHLNSRSHHVMPGSPERNNDHVSIRIMMMQEVHVIIRNANYNLWSLRLADLTLLLCRVRVLQHTKTAGPWSTCRCSRRFRRCRSKCEGSTSGPRCRTTSFAYCTFVFCRIGILEHTSVACPFTRLGRRLHGVE